MGVPQNGWFMDVNGQSYQNWWNWGTLNPPWWSASIISQSSLRSFKQISTCNSPQPAMTCSPLSSVLQTTNWSDFESRFKPSTNLGRSLPSWRNWGSFCQTGAGKVFCVFFYFFSGGLIGCELIRVYLLIDVDSWIIGCYRLLELIFPNIDKVGTSGIFGRRVWWCLVPLGSLGFTATFTTGDTLYFMSVKLWASSKVVMVPDFLRDLEVAVISKGIELLTVTNPKILMLIGKVVINHWLDVMISQLYQDQLWVISVFLLFDGNEGVSENLKSVNEDSSKSQYIPLDDSMHGAWDYTCSWHCSQS